MMRKASLSGAGMLALASLLILLAGCGREVKPANLEGARKAFADAKTAEQQGQLRNAEQAYVSAFDRASTALAAMVPGDQLLPEAEKLRNEASAQVARIREELRKQEATSVRRVAMSTPMDVPNLPPPVVMPEVKTPATPPPAGDGGGQKPPDGASPPATGPEATTPATPATPTATGPATPPTPEPPKPPEPARPLRITKVVLKDNKTLLVYWTFSNLADKPIRFGAPAGRATTKGGGKTLIHVRDTFDLKGFELNPDDPLASRGTRRMADSFGLQPGESREMITVGLFTDEAAAGQLGAVTIELRMSEGEDLSDKCMDIATQ